MRWSWWGLERGKAKEEKLCKSHLARSSRLGLEAVSDTS